jgi:hypothetical protein
METVGKTSYRFRIEIPTTIPFPKNTDTDKSDRENPETVFGIPKNSGTIFIPKYGHVLRPGRHAQSRIPGVDLEGPFSEWSFSQRRVVLCVTMS